LKLLEEKSASGELSDELPYSYRFHELAKIDEKNADQVRDAIKSMLNSIKKDTLFGDVLPDNIRLKNANTFLKIVRELSSVSFQDSGVDSKGAAFEYFVRATLKGKKLGQYFTPRPVVRLMYALVGEEKIFNSVRAADDIRVIDPACGTGGFLVQGMLVNLEYAKREYKKSHITKSTFEKIEKKIKSGVFFGSDANEAVASSAKMNMIIAGDGHSNIRCEDSLSKLSKIWGEGIAEADIVITNPPFGTSESDSLSSDDREQFSVPGSKGQHLFLQRMVASCKPGGDICTVIDDGILNNESSTSLRKFMLEECRLKAIVQLPDETFKPNKINVSSSIILLEKRNHADPNFSDDYRVKFINIRSLGYTGSGETKRGWSDEDFLESVKKAMSSQTDFFDDSINLFHVDSSSVTGQKNCRIDLKYWEPKLRTRLDGMHGTQFQTVGQLSISKVQRGKSPQAALYVDSVDGFAAVVKAGSSISKFGVLLDSEDFIEKDIYEDFGKGTLRRGDVLLASTGTGTLGKACVYESDKPAVADGHVTVIRPNMKKIDPHYLADYLRIGIGALQIQRAYTGSTGLIELTEESVNSIVVDLLGSVEEQKEASKKLRAAESRFEEILEKSNLELLQARRRFAG
jgi:type I restriction enzyme M protein